MPPLLADGLIDSLVRLAPGLHNAGTFNEAPLRALACHAASLDIQHSAETGSGASTILLSHLSRHHLAFTVNAGGSVENVKSCPLFRPERVEWVIGPSQLTLPSYDFRGARLQFVLLDGPHAWPFPDLEYYYLYRHISPGGLLVLDDLQIRSIGRMAEILRADAMWRLEERVENTAFFRRTEAPVFCPIGDSWWEQGYNVL